MRTEGRRASGQEPQVQTEGRLYPWILVRAWFIFPKSWFFKCKYNRIIESFYYHSKDKQDSVILFIASLILYFLMHLFMMTRSLLDTSLFQKDQNFSCLLLLLILKWKFFASVRSARKLKYQNYLPCKSKTLNNGNSSWECSEPRSDNECKVELIFDESKNILNQSGEHSHSSNLDQVQEEIIHSHIKRNARTS